MKNIPAKLRMSLENTVTGSVAVKDLPYTYRTHTQAYNAVDFYQGLGGEWSDHDDINSNHIHVRYSVVPATQDLFN